MAKTDPLTQSRRNLPWVRLILLMGSAGAIVLTGCAVPRPHEQRLVAKPNMTFSDSAAFSYNSPRLIPQLAPGFASASSSQNSGCTSCR